MLGNNTGKFILAGLAAFAWYKYSKMSKEEKSKLGNDIKTRGQQVYDQYVPEEVKNIFGKKHQNGTYASDTGY